MIDKYDATLYKSENFAILEYCYDNYASNAHVKLYIEAYPAEGVLDKGVSGQPDYIHRPDYRSVKIQDSRLRLVSGWDSPLRGRQAWRSRYYVSFLVTDSM